MKSSYQKLLNIDLNLNIGDTRNYSNIDNFSDLFSEKTLKKLDENKLVLTDEECDKNRILLWLTSEDGDYVRTNVHGILYRMLGQRLDENTLEYWRNQLVQKFNIDFNNELSIIYLDLSINKKKRSLVINMVVKNNRTEMTTTTQVEASL